MPKHHKKQRSRKQSGKVAIMKPAPFLHREQVTLTDVIPLAGNDQGGFFYAAVGPNGATNLTLNDLLPQVQIWDQYAAMYQFYQAKHISFKYVPYRIQGKATNDAQATQVYNTYSIQSPVDTVPLVNGASSNSAMFSYGNCHIKQGYDTHVRSMSDFTNLGLQKQNEIILKTNGSHQQRQQYVKPATMFLTGTSPSFASLLTGDFVFSITYEFSGLRAPNVTTSSQPVSAVQPQALQTIGQPMPQPVVNPAVDYSAQMRLRDNLRAQLESLNVKE